MKRRTLDVLFSVFAAPEYTNGKGRAADKPLVGV
jgi:hypothetical protein